MNPPATLGAYSVHIAREGFGSIVHTASGEIMHSRTPPMEEARALYAEQSRLAGLLARGASREPLVVWDVGLGAAANAIAAIECRERLPAGAARPLRVVSFDNDLDPLRLALAHIGRFPYLAREGPPALLEEGRWSSPDVEWEFVPGDFEATLERAKPAPDVIFYDMFSSRTVPGPWRLETLRRLFEICAGRPAELFTYTASTAARATLLAAGFCVAQGRNAGHKLETTIALTPAALGLHERSLLGPDWLAKWRRSTARYPGEIGLDRQPDFARAIESHPQFAPASAPGR